MLYYVVMPVMALVTAAGLSWAVRRAALSLQAVVPARSDRWHRAPTPTFGGVAFATTTLVFTALLVPQVGPLSSWHDVLLVLGSSVVLFAVGLLDDRLQLTPLAKLVATLVVGSFLVYGGTVSIGVGVPWWQTVVLVVWFAGIVHAFNLLDNMDGLATAIAIVAALALAGVFGDTLGRPFVLLLLLFAGALGGFLYWNARPARLFMGDCGSLFLGAVIAGTSLVTLLRPESSFVFDGFVVCLLLVVPLLDTSFVLVLRRLAGRPASRGGTDHLSHRLVSLGFSERATVGALAALGLAGSVAAYFTYTGGVTNLPAGIAFMCAAVLLGIGLARVPAYNGEDFQALQKSTFAPFLRDAAFRWHALEILLDVVAIAGVHYASYRLRFEGEQLAVFLPTLTASLPIVLGCKLLSLYVCGAYNRIWTSFSVPDMFDLAKGVAVGSVASILVAAYVYRFERFSRGVFVIDAALLMIVLVATRSSFRALGEAAVLSSPRGRRTLVYGAGSAGQLLIRELRSNPAWGLVPVAFSDDDTVKVRRRLLGVPIVGGNGSLDEVLTKYRVEEVVLSSVKIDQEHEALVRRVCARRGIPVKRFRVEIAE